MNSNQFANRILLSVILVPTLIFVLLHLTPKLSVRTHVLFDGHPIVALTSPLKSDEDQFHQKYYSFTKKGNQNKYIFHLNVKKKGFLYFAKNYNPGV